MNIIHILVLFLSVVFLSSLITGFVRKFTLRKKILDIPNFRSSHNVPTPKGGGLSIVLILLISVLLLYLTNNIGANISISIIAGVSLVSIVALIDDFKNISILIRATLYIIASIISIYLIGGVKSFGINNYLINVNYLGYPIAVLSVVWLTNLYNFMDGTDGFAAVQTICIGFFAGVLLLLSNNTGFAIFMFSLVASTTGFLYWNWSPAKIFMGDVGSCTIGFLFGLLSLYMDKTGVVSISVWLILLAPFISDATFTLIKRILNQEKWYKAHNSHAYQKLYKLGLSHHALAVGLLLINIIIIWPLAYIAYISKNLEVIMLVLTYSFLGTVWLIVQVKSKNRKKAVS